MQQREILGWSSRRCSQLRCHLHKTTHPKRPEASDGVPALGGWETVVAKRREGRAGALNISVIVSALDDIEKRIGIRLPPLIQERVEKAQRRLAVVEADVVE